MLDVEFKVAEVEVLNFIATDIDERLAVANTFQKEENSSFILVKYTDRKGRKVSVQLNKDDDFHFIYIDGVRKDMIHTSKVLRTLY